MCLLGWEGRYRILVGVLLGSVDQAWVSAVLHCSVVDPVSTTAVRGPTIIAPLMRCWILSSALGLGMSRSLVVLSHKISCRPMVQPKSCSCCRMYPITPPFCRVLPMPSLKWILMLVRSSLGVEPLLGLGLSMLATPGSSSAGRRWNMCQRLDAGASIQIVVL